MAEALPTCYLNGEFVATDAARISPLDRGFLFGDGVYEVVPCYGGRPLRLESHLERLAAGLEALGIGNPRTGAQWRELFAGLVGKNGGGDLGVYLEVTRGTESGRDFLPAEGTPPTVFGFAWTLAPPDPDQRKHGIKAVTLEDIRWLRCDIKSVALLAAVMLRREAQAQGADEAILVRGGRLAEGSSSCVFVVRDGVIATPPASHERLPSITREVVADSIQSLELGLKEQDIACADLTRADEIWLASSTREVIAVTRLDGQPVGNGTPGPLWGKVHAAFQQLKQRECGA
ncbi:MAG: D-amino acid aminotransferase [Gammaproteobacteria bacterium]|nr:D-amino acid aminotransferase [Gammaproteobacteria bacterium]